MNESNKHPKAFISYSTDDKERFVDEFYHKLREKGVDAFLDEYEIKPGDNIIDKVFEKGIGETEFFIIVLSESSVNKSWVKEEAAAAVYRKIENKIRIIPILLDRDIEYFQSLRHIARIRIDDISDYKEQFEDLLMLIYGREKKPPLGEVPNFAKVDYNVPGLTENDALVLKALGDLIIEENLCNVIPHGESIINKLEDSGLSDRSIEESLQILESEHFVKIHHTPQIIHSAIQLTPEGFKVYAENFLENYDIIYKQIVSAIFNDNLFHDYEIESVANCPKALIHLILRVMDSEGYIELSSAHMGGIMMIEDPTIQGRRHFKDLLR